MDGENEGTVGAFRSLRPEPSPSPRESSNYASGFDPYTNEEQVRNTNPR
jgi:hypothetical protein